MMRTTLFGLLCLLAIMTTLVSCTTPEPVVTREVNEEIITERPVVTGKPQHPGAGRGAGWVE